MIVTGIAAATPQGVIGRPGGGLPWRLPRDVERFRRHARGRHLVLGRITYEEMLGWFENETPIVLTRRKDFPVPNGVAVGDPEQALTFARTRGAGELVAAGGAATFAAMWPVLDRLLLTVVHAAIADGPRLPTFPSQGWTLVEEEFIPRDGENEHAMTFQEWRRGAVDGER